MTLFFVVNPDTIWNAQYLKEIKLMEKSFFEKKINKCSLLVVNQKKSFDKTLKGDFNLKNNLISRNKRDDLNYIYTGLQIIRPEVFCDIKADVFSINRIWDKLIESYELYGIESHINFLHVSTLDIYKSLLESKLNVK